MRNYELTVLFGGNLTEKELEKEIKSLKDLLASTKAKIKNDPPAGGDAVKKTLAYEIAGNRDASYLFYLLEAKPEDVAALESKLKLHDKLIRYLLIKKE